MPVIMEAYIRVWLMDIMQERGSICVHVLLAELRWLGGNGPAEHPSLTLILLPLLQLLQILAIDCCPHIHCPD